MIWLAPHQRFFSDRPKQIHLEDGTKNEKISPEKYTSIPGAERLTMPTHCQSLCLEKTSGSI